MEIRFLSAGCGDAVHIRFEGTDNQYRNILIDGGTERSEIYQHGIRTSLQSILERGEQIDLWIITHIDDDHIGGLLRFIKDKDLFQKFNLSKTEFWYNWWPQDYSISRRSGTRKSVKQAIRLREFLEASARVNQSITDETGVVEFFGATLTLLSPNADTYNKLINKWKNEEVKLIKQTKKTKKKRKSHDYNILIDSFELSTHQKDTSVENGSSISFLLQYRGKSILFTADSFPSVVAQSIREHGFTTEHRLVLDYMQLAHHGSRLNTSPELLDLVDCKNFVVSANGFNSYSLPHKETFARVIRQSPTLPVNFYITHQNNRTEAIFKVDKVLTVAQIHFPKKPNSYISLSLQPL